MAKVADKYFVEDEFKIIEEGFNPAYGQVAESVFSLGNEYMGIRGCFEEGYSGDSLRGSYFNGIYEKLKQSTSGYKGVSDITEYMVNSVDYFACRLEMDGEVLDLHQSRFRGFRRELDLQTGILTRTFIWETLSGKEVEVRFERFLCMDKSQIGAQKIEIEPLNFSGEIKLEMILDFSALHVSAQDNLWVCSEQTTAENYLSITGTTRNTGQKVTSQAKLFGQLKDAVYWEKEKQTGITGRVFLTQGEVAAVGRIVRNLVCKNSQEEKRFERQKAEGAAQLAAHTYQSLKEENRCWWQRIWERSDIQINGDAGNQQGIRFCIFQMFQTYHGTQPGTNIGAKGLTGEAYNGNAFWDTETYCLPFYVFNDPRAARNLLLFRYLTLQEAVERARELDCAGAFYPIATISGKECCNLWQHASLQLQASTAVAYGIWFYQKQTGDNEFVREYGAKMLVEISRMLATRGDFSADGSRYGYYCVMGPDEFQMMVNHNYYTNYMGKFTLEYTAAVLNQIELTHPEAFRRLVAETGITSAERRQFERIAGKMVLLYQETTGLFEQHEGYFSLPHVDIHAIPVEDFPLYHHWSYDRIYRNDMIKQPDVLMLMFLFNSDYTEEQIQKNYEFYEPRCIHESSLSPSVHSVLAAQLKKHEAAYDFFAFATRMDLDNYNRNTQEGLHTTSIAAAWINIVYGFGGMRSDGELLSFNPSIPARWNSYSFRITYQEEVLLVKVGKEEVSFRTKNGKEIELMIYARSYLIGGVETLITIPQEWKG